MPAISRIGPLVVADRSARSTNRRRGDGRGRPRSGCCSARRRRPRRRAGRGRPGTATGLGRRGGRRGRGPCSRSRRGCAGRGRRRGSRGGRTRRRGSRGSRSAARPPSPTRANAVSGSSHARVLATASWWASSTACRVRGRPERPQQRRGLDRGEDQVVAGHRPPLPAGLLGLDLRPHHRRRGTAVLALERRQPRGDPLRARRQRLVLRERPAQLRRPGGLLRGRAGGLLEGDDLLGVRVQAAAEQGPHLVLADPSRDLRGRRRRRRSSGRVGCRRRCSSRPAAGRGSGPRHRRRPAGSGRCTRRRRAACAASSRRRHRPQREADPPAAAAGSCGRKCGPNVPETAATAGTPRDGPRRERRGQAAHSASGGTAGTGVERAHNPEVAGSNPAPATSETAGQSRVRGSPRARFLRSCQQTSADIASRCDAGVVVGRRTAKLGEEWRKFDWMTSWPSTQRSRLARR